MLKRLKVFSVAVVLFAVSAVPVLAQAKQSSGTFTPTNGYRIDYYGNFFQVGSGIVEIHGLTTSYLQVNGVWDDTPVDTIRASVYIYDKDGNLLDSDTDTRTNSSEALAAGNYPYSSVLTPYSGKTIHYASEGTSSFLKSFDLTL